MHIPDGYLGPQTFLPLYAATIGFLTIALKKIKHEVDQRHIPYIAMAAAFSFLIMMYNIPTPGGTTGHAVGAGIIALLLGPWVAVLAVSVVLIIQALIFGDGGITALGANCFNMAVVMPFISCWTFRLIRGRATGGKRLLVAAFFAGYIGLVVTSVIAAIEFGIQPLIAVDAEGRPRYAPYPISIAVPVMALEHLALFGIIEGLVTMLLFRYFMNNEPEAVWAMREN
jgi:cobalt/nickel transport system permease protein